MAGPSAVLIGFQEQGNLGIGYVAAALIQRGVAVRILDFRDSPESILAAIRATEPTLVGFSLIFQYYVPQFRALATYLRDNGVRSHFCAGGHYPSLRYAEVLRDVPALDSVIRFEGERTLPELLDCLVVGRDWRSVPGIAYHAGEECLATPARPLIADLDELPFPARPLESALTVLGQKASPILASRGCSRACAFCSIREFYRQVPGKKVRVRQPERVVEEMQALYADGVRIFLFLDDDFPVWGQFGQRWSAGFITALQSAGLYGKVVWKISCRSDEVEPELFGRLRDAGLYVVYLGIESGTDAGLQVLNKHLTVEEHYRAVATLADLGLAYTYGFMLFDPSTTFASIQENVRFLRRITAGGALPVVFCRMLPYAGTPIEAQLAAEGRLRGSVANPDYSFLDPRLDRYFAGLNERVADWMQGADGFLNQVNFAWHEYWVMHRLVPGVTGLPEYGRFLRLATAEANEFLLDTVANSARSFEAGDSWLPSLADFERVRRRLQDHLVTGRDAFVARNQARLLACLPEAAEAERAAPVLDAV